MDTDVIIDVMFVGHGIPNQKAREKHTSLLDPSLVLSPQNTVSEFESSGGHLQLFSKFGQDPLFERPDLQQMHQVAFDEKYPHLEPVYHRIVNFDY